MKKQLLRSLVITALLLVVYNLLVFVIPFERETNFWITYGFTLACFAEVYASVYVASIHPRNAKSRYYGFPIMRIGFMYAGVQLVLSVIFMALGEWLPWELVLLVQAVALVAAALGLIATDAIADNIQEQDDKLKKNVALMRSVQTKIHQMVVFCEDPEAAAAVKALADEFRYSDPVSSPATAEADANLVALVDALQQAVADGDVAGMKDLSRKTSAALADRNRICKLNKS